jgi:hypothetical protein
MALEDTLADLKDLLEELEVVISEDPGPLNDPEKAAAATKLTQSEAKITTALSQINNLGAADTSNLPSTLPAIADECVVLASDAHTESLNPNCNRTLIGNKVKTIDYIIDAPNGYRAKAGIV